MKIKYSDQIAIWLKSLGYTHFFYVGGGNIMHLTESLSNHLIGIPVIHEVAAGVATEYFNVIANGKKRALSLVTAGPGLTNITTAVAGAWLESRELLIIGGQVKVSDLSSKNLRSRGIQEIKGINLMKSITKSSIQLKRPINSINFKKEIIKSIQPRKGPVFIEIPLNVQAAKIKKHNIKKDISFNLKNIKTKDLKLINHKYNHSSKPIILIGGGVDYKISRDLQKKIIKSQLPVMTTYNGADRVDGDLPNYFGRPNTWGQRSSNIIIQQSDLIIAVGTRLGLQQPGFNWKEFGRKAYIVQIEIDNEELLKGHPKTNLKICADANDFFKKFLQMDLKIHKEWHIYCRKLISSIPRIEKINKTGKNFISPYQFIISLEALTNNKDLIIPCSSGSAFTLTMQLYKQKFGQRIITNKSLASMGYGLSGAIGANIAAGRNNRTILIEGDGGFAQNLQEMGTAKINNLNLKIFIFNDQGHASIRMTQINYFNGKYLGCDKKSGLGLPNWKVVFNAWGVKPIEINKNFENDKKFLKTFNKVGLSVYLVKIDPKQTYFPKISSKVTKSGTMVSNPIDKMSPEINYFNISKNTE